MALDNHIRRGHPILFGLLIFFAIIEGSTAAWLTAHFHQHPEAATGSVKDRTYFLLFTSWWTAVVATIYMLLFLHSAGGSVMTSVASHGIFLLTTWIFWTAGAIAITQALDGGTNCSTVQRQVIYCNQLNALIAFAWVPWLITSILLLFVLIRGVSALRRGDGMRGQLVTA